MTEPHDDLLAEIRESLRVDPAPGFTRGVLDRIETNRASSWRPWELAAAAVVVIGVGVTTALLMSRPALVHNVGVTADPAAGVGSGVPVEARRIAPDNRAAMPTERTGTTRANRVLASTAATPRQPEVLVPSDQAILMRQLLEAVAQGTVVVPPKNAAIDEPIAISALQAPAPLEIPLIVIEPLPTTVGS